ncbi:MAG: hypothetical protein AAF298_14585 [Cyanobacteria bacterium P01_A01_bin.40]
MKDLERIREEIITVILLLLTLAFTSSNLTPELLEDKSLTQKLPTLAAIN